MEIAATTNKENNPTLLEGTSIDTENAAERIRVERPILPYVLDERMLRFYADSDKKQQTELLLEIFREYEGKEKERLGKQYENSAGQRIYGPVISSSVESMLKKLLDIGNDLGQYRRFIEFNVGKAEDKRLFDANEAVQAEEIANSCYGYGIRYIVEYMLYQFEQDDRYFENQFKLITTDIKERLKQAQNTYRLSGLTSSSMRIALIILSYQVLRESFIYKEQLEMIGTNKKEDMSDSERKIYDQCIGILVHEEEMMYDFDRIEDERKGFQCFCVGGFDKGAIAKEDEKLVKTVGYEYVWCKGLPAEYTDIPKVTDKV